MPNFDACEAIYTFCSENHTGQSSKLYGLMSRLWLAGFRPSPLLLNSGCLTGEGKYLYRRLQLINAADIPPAEGAES